MRIRGHELAAARRVHRLLPLLMPTLRSITDAQRELQWLQTELPKGRSLARACYLRGRGVPLQYILGSQPFGDLDILCQRRVLIPRWETESWILELAALLSACRSLAPTTPLYELSASDSQDPSHAHNSHQHEHSHSHSHQSVDHSHTPDLVNQQARSLIENISVVDLCTGTGCIPLLLSASLTNSKIYGVDKNPRAVSLFKKNIAHNARAIRLASLNNQLIPIQGDISIDPDEFIQQTGIVKADLVTANPPYILQRGFFSTTERSVRLYEPRDALLGDTEFYDYIFRLSVKLNAKAIVCEVGSSHQIRFMESLARASGWSSADARDLNGQPRLIAVWRDPGWGRLLEQMTDSSLL